MKPFVAWSSRLYRVMLRGAYPAQFREDYAQEMIWFYEDCCEASLSEHGVWGMILLWMQLLPDWGMTVVKERLLSVGYQGANTMDTTQFNSQLTSTMAVFSRALRDGYSVLQSIEIIAEHAPEPTKSAMQKVLDNVSENKDMAAALSELENEAQSPHLTRFMDAIRKQRQEGGNLADRMDEVIREITDEIGDDGWAKTVDLEDGYDFDVHYPVR